MQRFATAVLLTAFATAAGAADGPWMVRVGAHNADPKSNNGTVAGADATVGSDVRPTFNVDYFFTPNLALDVLASTPFEHDIELNGTKVGTTQHLPPTFTLQYHFAPGATVRPYAGLGVNYTMFFGEDSAAGDLKLDDSIGLAAHAGVDVAVARDWTAGVDVRWMDIDTDVSLDGTAIGTAEIDPIVYGFTVGRRF